MSHRSGALSQAEQIGSQRCVVLPVLSTQSRKRTNAVPLGLESPKLSRIKRLCLKLELSRASEEPTCDVYGYTYVVRQGEYSVLTKRSMQRCHELNVGYIHDVAQLRRLSSVFHVFLDLNISLLYLFSTHQHLSPGPNFIVCDCYVHCIRAHSRVLASVEHWIWADY
jgi:hypothetical protein